MLIDVASQKICVNFDDNQSVSIDRGIHNTNLKMFWINCDRILNVDRYCTKEEILKFW